MNKILNISVLFCLLGLSGSFLYGTDLHSSETEESRYTYSDSSLTGDQDSAISRTKYPALFIAETLSEVRSEIDPRSSISADWASNKNKYSAQFQYLIRASLFESSQSVRNLIFPFHSHL
ncbi:hypothetical protein DYD21_18305 [Rhodohalobacter sp. SW132]|uniref:hypothetical protein n=1 Tax=Rhodohalobacter sp. SW132 TaxID=2293433 RepID=UPI000E276CEA|nr:hypothetical protein [Rhodohalobacter sp. SW132]REL24541.1 hypothetical protein DYD21_18305 [Rhodohalobacter sp. SW132]